MRTQQQTHIPSQPSQPTQVFWSCELPTFFLNITVVLTVSHESPDQARIDLFQAPTQTRHTRSKGSPAHTYTHTESTQSARAQTASTPTLFTGVLVVRASRLLPQHHGRSDLRRPHTKVPSKHGSIHFKHLHMVLEYYLEVRALKGISRHPPTHPHTRHTCTYLPNLLTPHRCSGRASFPPFSST